MPVHAKLNKARLAFHAMPLKKSGHNTFAGYRYFELADFLIPALKIFDDFGLCATVSFSEAYATMNIVDIEDGSQIVITSPMGSAALKGCHEVQNIGAVESYQTRYLWTAALFIQENDALDATTGKAEPVKSKASPAVTTEKLKKLIQTTGADEAKICAHYNVSDIEELGPQDKGDLHDILATKAKKGGK